MQSCEIEFYSTHPLSACLIVQLATACEQIYRYIATYTIGVIGAFEDIATTLLLS